MNQMVAVPWPPPWEAARIDAIKSGKHFEHLERTRLSRIFVMKPESFVFLLILNLWSFKTAFKVFPTSSCCETVSHPE